MLMNVCPSSLTPGSAANGACVRKQAPGMAALGSAKTGALRRSAVSGAILLQYLTFENSKLFMSWDE
jgi:hypothetical protein